MVEMTQFYIGCKVVEAWPAQGKDGSPGYAVKYQDGYQSWSPKDSFEKNYLSMGDGDGTRITQEMVDAFVAKADTMTVGAKTTVVQAHLVNGFDMIESSACVEAANYNEALGASICISKIKDRVWHLLGFLLQSARTGFRVQPPQVAVVSISPPPAPPPAPEEPKADTPPPPGPDLPARPQKKGGSKHHPARNPKAAM